MRLLELRIRGFAQLRGSFRLDGGPGRVGLLLADNEAGKSTLAAAVRAALYGLESDRRRSRGKKTEQERYRPWSGGPYGLTLGLEHGGHELLIDRDFAQGSVRVMAGGREIGAEFQRDGELRVGEMLTGLGRSQFELSCFVGQGDVVFTDAGELSEALQRLAASDRSATTAASAIGVLDAALTQYEGVTLRQRGQVATEIKRCAEEIAKCEHELAKLESERVSIGGQLDRLGQDSLRRELFEHRREILRARRQHSELRQLWIEQDRLGEQTAKVEALVAQVERERSLRSLDPTVVQSLESARVALAADLRSRDDRASALRDADARFRDAETRWQQLELRRRPTEDDRERLLRASQRLEDARLRHHELELELNSEIEALSVRGFALDDAERLAAQFEGMTQEDREHILARTQETMQLEQRHMELSEEKARHQRRRAEIRQSQQKRKHFGIWCLVVGMLPVMLAIVAQPQFPYAPWLFHGLGALFGLTGIASLLSGQSVGRREEESLKEKVNRIRAELGAAERARAEAARRWDMLAEQSGISIEELEQRYREWLQVDRSVDTIRRVRARLEQVAERQRGATDGLEPVWEIFGSAADAAELPQRQRALTEAIEVHRELDAADALRREAQRRADEAKAQLRSREQEIRQGLFALGIELEGDETLETGFELLRRKLHNAREANERASRELPEAQRRLQMLGDPRQLAERVAQLQGELERREDSLRRRAARGGDFAFDEESLKAELSAEAYDRELSRLDRQERELRSHDEEDRNQAQNFLVRYEREAPELRARLEEHQIALRRAEQFAQAVQLARDTLETISQETHRDWSTDLNAELAEILRELGSDIEEAQLDDKLRLRVAHSGQMMPGDEAQQHLSIGASETLYLAVRIALARALGGETQRLPLILDDPFANADDEHLIQGLELLLQRIAPQQQVILMACQGSRYAWARHRLSDASALATISIGDAPGQDAAR